MFHCERVAVLAPGKINLCLDITGRTEDGYHTLDTVMQTVSLSDLVVIGKRPDGDIRIGCSREGLPLDEENIAHKAAAAFFRALELPVQGLSIYIDKRIPAQAGLGGGSADGAAVLWGLNHLFGAGLDKKSLCKIGLRVGADIPFCLTGGCMLAQGKGELFTPLGELPDCWIVIAKPTAGVSTAEAYGAYDSFSGRLERPDVAALTEGIISKSLVETGRQMGNVFEQVLSLEGVEAIKCAMLCEGALGAALSGSGSAVAGLFREEKEARHCLENLPGCVESAHVARPTHTGAEVIHSS